MVTLVLLAIAVCRSMPLSGVSERKSISPGNIEHIVCFFWRSLTLVKSLDSCPRGLHYKHMVWCVFVLECMWALSVVVADSVGMAALLMDFVSGRVNLVVPVENVRLVWACLLHCTRMEHGLIFLQQMQFPSLLLSPSLLYALFWWLHVRNKRNEDAWIVTQFHWRVSRYFTLLGPGNLDLTSDVYNTTVLLWWPLTDPIGGWWDRHGITLSV